MSSFLSKRLALAVISIVSAPVGAATVFEVNTFQDAVDAAPGTGTCATITGACSLRAAIQEANALANGPHTIKVPAGTYSLSLQGSEDIAAAGDLDINSSMIIEGFGADKTTIQVLNPPAGTDYRVFHVGATSSSPLVTIKGVTIKGGQSSQGAGINLQTGTLDLVDSQIDSNFVSHSTSSGGAGIYTNATLRIKNSSIANNQANNNTSGVGGAVYIGSGALRTEITNSTIYNNTVFGSQGGGIYNASASPLIIASSTIHRNVANGSSAVGVGLFSISGASVQMRNSIVAGSLSSSIGAIDCGGAITSGGYNLVGLAPNGGACAISTGAADQIGAIAGSPLNPNLGAFQNNGGTTSTLLPTGLPLVDLGNPTECLGADGVRLSVDQRGYVRHSVGSGTVGSVGRCDIGAVEANSSYTATSVSGGTGPVAGPQAFTAYYDTAVSGSLLGANPDLSKTDSSINYPVTTCSGSTAGNPTSSSGLIFCPDPVVTPRGTLSGPNPATGYFSYSPSTRSSPGSPSVPITGTDSFSYYVQNTSGQRATGVVSIVISNVGVTIPTAPVVPTAGLTLAAKIGGKVRAALPYIDVDAGGSRFTVTFASNPTKGTAAIRFNNAADNHNSSYLEYTPFDTSSGADTFTLNIDDGANASQLPVTVNIGTGTTTVSSSAPVALSALIKDDISRSSTSPTVGDLRAPAGSRIPIGVTFTFAKTQDLVPAVGTINFNSDGTFTYTPPTVATAENRVVFKVTASYNPCSLLPAGTACSQVMVNLPEVPVTLNFAVAGASTIPVPNQFSSPATVPRTSGGTFSSATASPLLTSITLPSGATSIVFDVSNAAGGSFSTSASSSLGRVDVSTPSNGAFLYTVTSGTAVTANQDTFYYRVRYTDSLGTPVTTTSAAMFLNFIGAPAAPVATAFSATAVPRTGIFSPLQNLSTYVTGLASGVIPTIEVYSSASGWSVLGASSPSVVGFYGTLTIMNSQLGTFTYTPNASLTSIATSDQFQYRARYNDGVGGTTTTSPATLTLNFVSAALPVAHGHTVVVSSSTSTRVDLAGSPVVPGAALQYILVTPPTNGDLYDANGTTMIMVNAPFSSAILQYRPKNNGATGDTFVFKVREGTVDSLNATMPLTYSSSVAPTPLEEGGGGSLSPLALLAMLALYGRRRFH